MPTPGDAPVGCSSQSSGLAWVEAWLPDAQAHSAKVALTYLAHICRGVVTSNGRYLDLCFLTFVCPCACVCACVRDHYAFLPF